jgi:hypothetical protein
VKGIETGHMMERLQRVEGPDYLYFVMGLRVAAFVVVTHLQLLT